MASENCDPGDVNVEVPILIVDGVDTNIWQIECIISRWVRKRTNGKLVCLGSSPVTDRLSSKRKLKVETYRIDYTPYSINSIYAPDQGLPLSSLVDGLKARFCVIDGDLPSRKVTSCPEILFLNPKSQAQVSRIFSRLALRNPVTIYFLLTKQEFLNLPENASFERPEYEQSRMLKFLPDPEKHIFRPLEELFELNEKLGITQSRYISILEWKSMYIALLEHLETPHIEDTFIICLLESQVLINTMSLDYKSFRTNNSVLEAHSMLAITILDNLKNKELSEIAFNLGLNLVSLERAYFNFNKIRPTESIKDPQVSLRGIIRRIAGLIPEMILQFELGNRVICIREKSILFTPL